MIFYIFFIIQFRQPNNNNNKSPIIINGEERVKRTESKSIISPLKDEVLSIHDEKESSLLLLSGGKEGGGDNDDIILDCGKNMKSTIRTNMDIRNGQTPSPPVGKIKSSMSLLSPRSQQQINRSKTDKF